MKITFIKMDDEFYLKDLEDSEFRIALMIMDRLFFKGEKPP